jgi:hypothetical protein
MSTNKRISFVVVTETLVKANNKAEALQLARMRKPTTTEAFRISASEYDDLTSGTSRLKISA